MHTPRTPKPFLRAPLSSGRSNRRFAVERLEPRWLLSANPLAVAVAHALAPVEPEPTLHDLSYLPTSGSEGADAGAAQSPAQTGVSTWDLSRPMAAAEPALAVAVPAVPGDAFSGAAVALDLTQPASSPAQANAQLGRLMGEAMDLVQQQLGSLSAQELLALFPGAGPLEGVATDPDALLQRAEAVRQQWLAAQVDVEALLLDGSAMGQAMAGFTAHGPSGGATVFVNAQWLASLGEALGDDAGDDSAALRVLVEELGHSIDAAIHGDADSPGDEGENFAALVLALPLDAAQTRRIALEDDRGSLVWGLTTYVVEQATFATNQDIATGQITDANIQIDGDVTLTSTYVSTGSGNGRLVLGTDGASALDGNGDITEDHLTLLAKGVVWVKGLVGDTDPLGSLTIGGVGGDMPNSVIFDQDVTLAGDLIIETEGVVTFSGKLTITGGNLVIRGATQIIFNDVVQLNGGNLLLEGDEIDLLGSAALRSTGGVLEMRTTTLGLDIEVGDPNAQNLASLNLTQFELDRIAAGGFGRIVLGHYTGTGSDAHAVAGQGAVRIAGSQNANQFTFHAPLEVYAGSITVEDINIAAKPSLAIKGSVKLDATGNIEIRNGLLATTDLSQPSAYQDITLYSSGGYVAQFNESRNSFKDDLLSEPIQGNRLVVRAQTGIDLFATEVNQATLVNHGATGGIRLTETVAGGAIELLRVEQVHADATGDVWLQSSANITVGEIRAANNDVAIITTASIVDGDTAADVVARGLYLQTGTTGAVGSTSDALDLAVQTLALSVGSGGAYLSEADALAVDTVAVAVSLASALVPADVNTLTGAWQDLITGQNASLVLVAGGTLTLNDGADADGTAISANGTGNVLVQTLGAGSGITANADITSTSGSISVLAGAGVTFHAQADIRTSSTGADSGSIDVQAGSGAITQDASSALVSTGASATVRLLAATDVTVGDIDVSGGQVSITATGGSVLDADALVGGANDGDQDISAVALRLNAGSGVGGSVNHLETSVDTLSAAAGNGGVYLLEADALNVGAVGLSVNRVGSDGALTVVTDASQSDITSGGNGAIVLRSTAGGITLNDGTDGDGTAISANGTGNVLVQTLGAGSGITANADITSTSGSISVLAGAGVTFHAQADIRTSSTGADSGSIDVQAGSGAITQDASSALVSTGASATVRLLAATDVTVGDIDVSGGAVSITATAGSILDADALVGVANDGDQDITAVALRLNAGTGVGGSVNHLETSVDTLSA
ncbi:LEPR-XLL domain-containing protein, partial [Hydrogenophaga sp.]|uniref:beta strand repeat-containing protein n=1 Tax=Hydrogenophaga sp. TaxID=1904254 RepID=UPI00286D75DF